MKIGFSTPMKTEGFNVTQLNTTFIDIYVVPADDRDDYEDFELKTINLTWKPISFIEKFLII